ncbi:MAG: hypothetical protein HYY84_02775 [Deltaproteobacteria bacterium]|nr:hypothetical protein [Deltaproteobacteria bacterium]
MALPADRDLRLGRQILYGVFLLLVFALCLLTTIGIVRSLDASETLDRPQKEVPRAMAVPAGDSALPADASSNQR